MLRKRHAKILATLGPASADYDTMVRLVEAGVDAFRLNFSHGSHDDHRRNVENIRKIEEKLGTPIAILQDLQGPKIRLGTFEGDAPQTLKIGEKFRLDGDQTPGTGQRVHMPHPEIINVLKVGDPVYINDGLVRLKVIEKGSDFVICEVIAGGVVSNRKGVNLPGVDLPMSAMTPKDHKDLKLGLELGVDWVALSFVQRPEDVNELRGIVGNSVGIMSKIEMPNAVKRIDQIIALSDAIMVARGDLGVEMPIEEVPAIQKKLIRKCREQGKPVVVATQMLESMTQNPSPTRAEASDVANAAYEGADVLMLSAESASGAYPVEAVAMMDSIIKRVEASSAWRPLMDARHPEPEPEIGDSITSAAHMVAESVDACCIVTFTSSGSTAVRMSRQRPIQPVLMLTPNLHTARRLIMAWGLHCRVAPDPTNIDEMVNIAVDRVQAEAIGQKGRHVVLTAGVPFGVPGSTNMLRVVTLA